MTVNEYNNHNNNINM